MAGEWAGGLPVKPWWEHQRGTVNCRDASVPQGGPCTEESFTSTHCSTTTDPATGEPVRHCVKLLKRYLRCAGRPEKIDEEKQEITAWGEGAQQLEPGLVPEVPSGRRTGASPAVPGDTAAQMEVVGHAFEEFLRFAEELQEEMVPGSMHLDEAPPPPPRPYGEPEQQSQAQQADAGSEQQQQRQQQQQQPPFSWLGGLLFGKRRSGAEGGGGRRHVDASAWKEFERDFTEV